MTDATDGLDQVGPPQPEQELPGSRPTAEGIAVIGALVAGLALLATCMVQPSMGATRSARLKWQERQRDVEQAVAAHRMPETAADEPARDK
jgi:hypothetical protein